MKILWWSVAPWIQSGYGTQTERVTAELVRQGHEVDIAALYGISGNSPTLPDGRKVHPTCGDLRGELNVRYLVQEQQYDVVVCLADAWPMNAAHWKEVDEQVPVVWWIPVDHETLPDGTRNFFETTGITPLPMSLHGEFALANSLTSVDVPQCVPHCYNPDVFGDRVAGRKAIGVGLDTFLVGMMASNDDPTHPRKGWPYAIEAFGDFLSRGRNAVMYIHAPTDDRKGMGMSLDRMAAKSNVSLDSLIAPSERDWYRGFSEQTMADLYAAFDVLLAPSLGEGFCIPLIEAQRQGTPVIANDASAQPDIVHYGEVLCRSNMYWDEHHGSWYMCPVPGEISEILDKVRIELREGKYRLDERAALPEAMKAYHPEVVAEEVAERVMDRLQ